jgi:HD-GYP domain-containing protein (c-di-GMP phosphodiesterase class II)
MKEHMLTESQKIDALINLSLELSRIKDLDILMEHILTEARFFVNADAGSIYIREGNRLVFSYTQNATLQDRLPPDSKLIYSTFSIPIDKNSIAGFVAAEGQALNIPDVSRMDRTLPYCFNQKFDEASGYKTQSMLTIPLKTQQGETIGVLQIINAQDGEKKIRSFSKEDERMMLHFASMATVALERAQLMRSIILRTIRMAEMRDPKETGSHVNRVASSATEIYEKWAKQNGISQREIDTNRDILRMAAMLHDAGKVAVSDTILKKAGKLNDEEFEMMKSHALEGARIFADQRSEFDGAAFAVSLSHHERWDGLGYPGHVDVLTGRPLEGKTGPDGRPLGKKGEEIPLFGRIVAIADVFDALSSKRSYKEAWDESRALRIMEEESGKQFDPELIKVFFSCLDSIRQTQQRYSDD